MVGCVPFVGRGRPGAGGPWSSGKVRGCGRVRRGRRRPRSREASGPRPSAAGASAAAGAASLVGLGRGLGLGRGVAASAPSARVLSWPSRPAAGALARATTRWAGASARLTTRPIRASRLGSLVMSSTWSGPMITPSTAPPLISGFLSFLTWSEISLASSATPVAAPDGHARAPRGTGRQAAHAQLGEDPAGQRVLQRPHRGSTSCGGPAAAGSRVTASRPLKSRIRTDRRPVQVGRSWSIIISLTYLLMIRRGQSVGGRPIGERVGVRTSLVRAIGRRPLATASLRPDDPDARGSWWPRW